MDRYQKVEKPKLESPINENEIRITAQGAVRNYITYATTLLQEKHAKEIVLKAMGQAINKTVAITEIIKKRIPRLHQDTAISSVRITDTWEPLEEGLVPVEMTRDVSMISITLSTGELNMNSPGYQAPQHVEQPKPQDRYPQRRQQQQYQQHQQPRQGDIPYNAVNEESYGRGRGRGRRRGRGRGRGYVRGGYGNYQGGGYGNYQRGGSGNYQEYDGNTNRGRDGESDNYQGGGSGNYQEYDGNTNRGRGGGSGNYQEYDGNTNRGRGGGSGNYQEYDGNSNRGRGGRYGNYQGDGYGDNQGGGYGNYQEYDGNSNRGRGGGRGRGWGYRGAGYERGRGGGGRGYTQGRGRMGGRTRGGGY